jgi:hypothetical protein
MTHPTLTENKERTGNFSYPQVRQQWFSVGIFPLGQLFGLTRNHPQSALRVFAERYGQV